MTSSGSDRSLPETPLRRLKTLFWIFFKISAVTVGGGLAMLPLLNEEFSEKRKWISPDEMVDVIAVVQSMPGIIAVNMAVMTGYRCAGIAGAIAASIGAILPPFFAILLIGMIFRTISGNHFVNHVLLGVRSATCALILLAGWKMAKKILKGTFPAIIASASFLFLILFPHCNAVWVIVGGAFAGLIFTGITSLSAKRGKENDRS